MEIKRLINCFVPVSVCNFECSYCYIPQITGRKKNAMPEWKLSPPEIAKALSAQRLGGQCFMNICGDGETLIPKEMPSIIEELLKEGHVLEIVTNGTLTERFEEIFKIDKVLLERLEFKFSYHYAMLKRKNMLDVFWNNVNNAKKFGCSFTIELTPHDELIPLIEEIKQDCLKNVGALCHITTAFNYADNWNLLTSLSKEEYCKVWGQFDSPMFDFKMSVLGEKRTEYCYAGEYLISVNIASGYATQCYAGIGQNIFDNIEKPIKWLAVGKHCEYPLCFNAHALMVFGAIPELATDIYYDDIRNRKCKDGTEWLSQTVKDAFHSKFIETNKRYSISKKIVNELMVTCEKIKRKLSR
ncbi:Organic radical activating enzyme [Butyrivibrio fibrisolvens DSM 3071]|uniref:Organic radical activating enzyme n=2 Tax=Butyrivibrio fibrisolvens TaxID=831 RepID=A0A1M6ERC4_BUTFI|nr:radical SAM protein [Butyrivibrio fibrisolvens]SHI87956.1 Organic radical activating enzyme [Butyrivibrio fibrisolvens DSM 3071]